MPTAHPPMQDPHPAFSDPQAVARYAEGPARNVPGWADLLRMADLLLAEQVPAQGAVLVVGAGGGLELRQFAQAHPGWRLCGIDPSAPMLQLAQTVLGPLAARVTLQHGHVAQAPAGPFDGASCLLTLHFVGLDDRRRLLAQVRRRLRPGAPFVMAHLSFAQGAGEREQWLSRYAAFITGSGVDAGKAQAAAQAVGSQLTVLAPAQEEALLHEAGFHAVQLFYAGLAFRGWVCRA